MEQLKKYLREERGRLRDLSASLNVSPATVVTWSQVPAHHCLSVESFTGISRHDLRPDVFGPRPETAA